MHIFSVRTISRQNGQKLQDFVRYEMFDVSAKFMISHKVGNFPNSGHFSDEKWEINHLTGKKNERTVSDHEDEFNISLLENVMLQTTYPALRTVLSEHLGAASKKKPVKN